MAVPELITSRDLTRSRFGQLVESADGINIPSTIARAEAIIQAKLNRKLKKRVYEEVSIGRGYSIFLRQRPVVSIISVTREGFTAGTFVPLNLSTLLLESDAGYLVSPRWIDGWSFNVQYEAGYDEVPEDIKEAIVIQSAMLFMRDLEIYGPGDGRPPGTEYLKKEIENLLAPHKQSIMV